jgi:hypothetical protein
MGPESRFARILSDMIGGHRLSESEDLNRRCRTVDQLLALYS